MKILVVSLKGWAGKHSWNGECSEYLLVHVLKKICQSPTLFQVLRPKFIPMSVWKGSEYILLGCCVLPAEKVRCVLWSCRKVIPSVQLCQTTLTHPSTLLSQRFFSLPKQWEFSPLPLSALATWFAWSW